MKQLFISEKVIKSGIALILAIVLFFCSQGRVPGLDTHTDHYFTEAIKKAGAAYATCRIVNASISILKESSLQLEPAGIGVSLALGQILDPIDDMTERLSDVLVTAITALGVQKLIYEISLALALNVLSVLLILFAVFLLLDHDRLQKIKQMTLGLLIIVAIIRITLPLSAFANAFIQEHFFEDRIFTAIEALSVGIEDIDHLKEISLPEIDGIKGTIDNSAQFLKIKITALKTAMASITQNMGMMIEHLLTLTFLYVGIFFIQVILLPVLTFWVLIKLVHAFFNIQVPIITHHHSKGESHAIRQH